LDVRRTHVESRANDPTTRWRSCHSISWVGRHVIGVLEKVEMPSRLQLLQVAKTLDPNTSLLGTRQCRQKQRGQNGNDGDDHQQFDQCESPRNAHSFNWRAFMDVLNFRPHVPFADSMTVPNIARKGWTLQAILFKSVVSESGASSLS
jgi:hypothetical protein